MGFGAHHWVASSKGQPTLFVTLDGLDAARPAASLEAAYAAASALARDLDFVLAPLASTAGRRTVAFGSGALSVTPWLEGVTPDHLDLAATAGALSRLHQAPPPLGIPQWTTLVPTSLADDLADLSRSPWDCGPYGERARTALRSRLDAVADWSTTYHALAEVARRRTWVVTHGEPHERNMVISKGHTWFVDWETVRLAPPERDWRPLVDRGWASHADLDAAMLDLFDLEWRLDEINHYAAWFSAPHSGSASDRVAIGGLLHELTRAEH